MYYVYILKSINYSNQIYIGFTKNLQDRLDAHNAGDSSHTNKYKPWELMVCITFNSKTIALEFEEYLKSHSGRAFAAKRLLKKI